MNDTKRDERIIRIIKEAAAQFLQQESSGASLLTVTDAVLSKDGKYATILFTALPEDKEQAALEFAKRKRSEFKAFVKTHTKLGIIPLFDFEIDRGEKHRQRIDILSQK
jgi:ribosome-binding factor A